MALQVLNCVFEAKFELLAIRQEMDELAKTGLL
jgi:hypothetical protein